MKWFRGDNCLHAVVFLLLLGLVSVSLQAKYGKYLHRTNPVNGTAKILKMTRDGALRRKDAPRSLYRPTCVDVPRWIAPQPVFHRVEVRLPQAAEYLSSNSLRSPPHFSALV